MITCENEFEEMIVENERLPSMSAMERNGAWRLVRHCNPRPGEISPSRAKPGWTLRIKKYTHGYDFSFLQITT